jgi:hypothetical protein
MAKKHMEIPSEKEWKFKRNRNGDEHVGNCADGYFNPKGLVPNRLEIHHILCVHACSDATFPASITDDEKTFIYVCLAISEWNINGKENNIGLPKKWAYVMDGKNTTGWDGLPCHQVDHDIYLRNVASYVRTEIWDKVKKAKKAEDCEELTGENIAQHFIDGSDTWKKRLTKRGKKYGGTKACLDYCLDGKQGPMADSNWYVPFSMAVPDESDARPRAKLKKLERIGFLIMAII